MLLNHILHQPITVTITESLRLHISLGNLEIGHKRRHLIVRQHLGRPLHATGGKQERCRGNDKRSMDILHFDLSFLSFAAAPPFLTRYFPATCPNAWFRSEL